ncbi:glucan biosynthesis protein G [Paracoccaceae bacterium Fryx2]|nr:glucan biosynthesis protein G [Paracoccaceae bacterium Fryx2]
MTTLRSGTAPMTRRALLSMASSVAALAAAASLPFAVRAQEAAPVDAAPQQFSFDLLSAEMRARAAEPHPQPVLPPGFHTDLNYDDYRLIRFRPDNARWSDSEQPFRIHAFHMGWLFGEPVTLYEVVDGLATEMHFSTDDFEYLNSLAERVPLHQELPGVAGFRLHMPMNRLDIFDELVAFLGASYFRALGQGNAYGISARGLALNTASSQPEEFPRFSRFYLERPLPGSLSVVVCAAMESPSVTGAYRFVITPGAATEMEITARLFFRSDVAQIGVAPLTSMFLFSEKNRAEFDDYRPNVHDSDGLRITRADGDILWRPLNNPPHLAGSYFVEHAPRSFGLHQRDRAFDSYQDTGARYEHRPSLEVEPIGDWGKGAVRLVEIPTRLEGNDNIVAFWVPEIGAKAGDSREFAYRLRWGALPPVAGEPMAYVFETRSGVGGVSGVESRGDMRKFVIDFKDGLLAALPGDAELTPVTSVQNGQIVTTVLEKIEGTPIWRLVLDVSAASGATVELGAHVAGYGRKLTETWLYQWINA